MVNLAISNLIVPSPCEQGCTGRCIGGDVDVECLSTGEWTGSDVGVDDVEGFSGVVAECGLTRSSAMSGPSCDREVVLLACIPRDDGCAC